MTDKVVPSQGEASSQLTSGVIRYGAQANWVVPAGDDYLAAFAGLSGTPLDGYEETHSSSSLDLSIDTGECFVGGRWAARDTSTSVTLSASTDNQTVYIGWAASTADTVIIGLDSAFSSGDAGRRMPLYECDTDGDGITNITTLYESEPTVAMAANAAALGGDPASEYANIANNETISGLWTFDEKVIFDDPTPGPSLDIRGSNETDSDVVRLVGDADDDQDDDLLSIFGVNDPRTDSATESDSVFVTKGWGGVGINNYNPTAALDVIGNTNLRGSLDMNTRAIEKAASIEVIDTQTGDSGVREGVTDAGDDPERFYIAPIVEGDPKYDEEITYYPGRKEWRIESENVTATDQGFPTQNRDIMTGDSVAHRCDVNIPNATLEDGEGWDQYVAGNNEEARITRVSLNDGNGNSPPSGCRVEISGEGGGQRKDFDSQLSGASLSNPLHTVGISAGGVRVRLYNNSGGEEILNCHVVMQLV